MQKPHGERNEKYLNHVRSLPDIIEGKSPSNAHHVKRKNDYWTVPIREPWHTVLNHGVHAVGVNTFQEEHSIDFKDIIIENLIRYIKGLEGKDE